jgi:hypothetical protein
VYFILSAWDITAALPKYLPALNDKNTAPVKPLLQTQNELIPWLESGSELYRQSDRRLSAKLVPTFADRGVSHGQCGESPKAVISVFYTAQNEHSLKYYLIHDCWIS